MKSLTAYSRIILALSALLLISAYFVPIWQILMWAPQYPEGLEMKIWINDITGDVKIISALNHYIGMRHIDVGMFPEFTYMIYIVAVLIVVGLLTSIVNRRFLLVAYALLLVVSGTVALVDFYMWGYDYGHNLDPRAPIVVPGMSYQPPLIGTKQLLNFTAFSGPDLGGWIFLVSGLLAIGTLGFEIYRSRVKKAKINPAIAIVVYLLMISCSTEPEPLQYGKDSCHACKMTLVDNKFGAEVVTKKGKIFKFDDTNCLINFLNNGQLTDEDIKHYLITDFASPGVLIDAKTAFYVKSVEIKSPMASNVAAFQNKTNLESQNDSWKGIELSWGELITAYK
ncbi:MAG: nitrous oxide reductase accessory protein NosL [Bacteroidota bacterium]